MDDGSARETDAGPGEGVEPVTGRPRRKSEQSESTRRALLAAARSLFSQHGFAAVATEDIVRGAQVTRGALYYHFADKEDLFKAVYEGLERELVERIAAKAMAAPDPLRALHAGAQAFLAECEDPGIAQVALIDAPSVLGWAKWREIGLDYGFGLVESTLAAAMDAGLIERQPVRALSHLLLGSIDEAAMMIARADDGGKTKREVAAAIDRYLDSLRVRQ